MGCTKSLEEAPNKPRKQKMKNNSEAKEEIIEKKEVLDENEILFNKKLTKDKEIEIKKEKEEEQKIEKEVKKLQEEGRKQKKIEQEKEKEYDLKYIEKIDFKELFMDNLTSSFIKLFNDNSKLFYSQIFLEGISSEYGLFGKKKNKEDAFKIYKNGADSKNDYLCMYRLHRIYLTDYKDFNLNKDENLEKIYLYKCFAYLPFSIINGIYFIFNKINITYKIAVYLDKEDANLQYFDKYMSFLEENKCKFNLKINDIKLMKLVVKAYFLSSKYKNNSNNLNEFLELEKGDEAYYEAKLKYCNFYLEFFRHSNKKQIINIFENLIKSEYYKAAYDYSNFLIDQGDYDKAKIIIKKGMENSQEFCLIQYSYIMLREKEINHLLSDYNINIELLNNMILSICFEKLNYSSVLHLLYYLFKHSSYKKELKDDYAKLLLEIYNNIEKNLISIENYEDIYSERYIIQIPFLFGQICYYGVFDEKKPDKEKSLSFFKKSYKLSKEKKYVNFKRINYLYIYKCRKFLFKNNKIKQEKLQKTKEKLFKLYFSSDTNNFNSFEFYNLYKLYKNGNASKLKTQIIALLKAGKNVKMIYNFRDYLYKEKCKIALKEYNNYCNN